MGADDGSAFSVNAVAALARHASMSTSYKPALLKALVRLARRGAGERIRLLEIGAEFVQLYWVQTVVFRLRQAATVLSEPVVVRSIRETAELANVRRLADLPESARSKLDRKMANTLKINVLEAFHASKPEAMPTLFSWEAGSDEIVVSEAALAFFVSNGAILESVANLWWARFLEKVNMLAPLVIEKVERDGVERASLSRFLEVLRLLDDSECFYCERRLESSVGTHIDHVIPWTFLLSDPLWDLVLACSRCNLAKSDHLPERSFMTKLAEQNLKRSRMRLSPRYASALIGRYELDRYFDAALSVEWPSGWMPTKPM